MALKYLIVLKVSQNNNKDNKGEDKDTKEENLLESDIRLKENINLIGKSPSGINIYQFNYINKPGLFIGVMAHEVPWASIKGNDGYLSVDYSKLDVDFIQIK